MLKIRTIVYLIICLCVTVSTYAQAIPNSTKSNEVLKLLLPRLNLQGEWTTLRFADGTEMSTAGGGAGDMAAATYDPQTIAGDAFDLSLHTGILPTANGGIGTNTAYLDTFTLAGTTTVSGNMELGLTDNANRNGIIYKVGGINPTGPFIHTFDYGYNGVVTTQGWNTFVGLEAGNLSMGSTATLGYHGCYNTGIGSGALNTNTIGYYNTACGVSSLKFNTEGYENAAFGRNAMRANTTGYNNTAVGYTALYQNTTGYWNTACGVGSLQSNISGTSSTAVGVYALSSNTTGNENVAVGRTALFHNTMGEKNVGIGRMAGYNAGLQLTTNSNCVFIGYSANSAANGISNSTAIGSEAQVTASNQVVIGNGSITTTLLKGSVGFGTTTPATAVHVIGTVTVSSGIIVAGSTMAVPDYVFAENYKLLPIEKLKEFVRVNQHLPEFESAKNTKQLNLVQDNMRLREAIEKLTLYLFDMKQEIADLKGL